MVSSLFTVPSPRGPSRPFFAGDENAAMNVALRVVLENDGRFLPLVLWGPTGVGKSLFAEGLAHQWRELSPDHEVCELTATDFARQFANAVDTDSISDFRAQLRKPGMIVLDGLHDLPSRPAAAREFCYQLSQWLRHGKIVVCTSLVPPALLACESLASRMSAGLSLELVPPAGMTRRRLVDHFAEMRSLTLTDPLMRQIAKGEATPRELEARVVQIETRAKLTNAKVDESLVGNLLTDVSASPTVEVAKILSVVAKRFGVTVDELCSSSRQKSLVQARGVFIHLARAMTGESLQALGKRLGGRDHSTVLHSLQTIEQSLESDAVLNQVVSELRGSLARKSPSRKSTNKARE